MHANIKGDFIKIVIVLGLLVVLGYFGYGEWQKNAQTRFCSRMQSCMKDRVFQQQFRSFEFCVQSQESLDVRLKSPECGENLDCDAWLACFYGVVGRKNPFDDEKSDFKKIESDIDPNRYRE